MSAQYALHVYRVHNVIWGQKFYSKVPDLYTKVKVGDTDTSRRTQTIKKNISPHWDEILTFSSLKASTNLNIQIRHESNWSPDPCVGYVDITLSDLLKESAAGEAQLSLRPPHGKGDSAASVGVLHLHLEVIGETASVEQNVKALTQGLEQSGIVHSAEAENSTAAGTAANIKKQSEPGELYEAFKSLITKLDIFVGLIDEVSKVHPYLNAAWQITSALYKGVSRQFQTDKRLVDLVRAMESAFDFARHAQSLPDNVQYLERTIIELLKQITECCLFVRQYSAHGFARRMIELDSSEKIEEFLQSLTSLRIALNSGNIIYTAFVSARMSNRVESLFLQQKLNPIRSNAFGRPTCLPGTRVEIQKEISSWILSETNQNILWLKGVAGSGKSTISTTTAEYFRDISRLGAFLFFERGKSEPSSVIPTIAYALASLNTSIATHMIAAVEKDNDIASASAKTQFEKLLLGPLTSADAGQGPIIIILDALDECGTPQSREDLIRLLREDFPKLPSHFRFLLTSRPENDIAEALSSHPSSVHEIEVDYNSDASRSDVLSYIKYKMHKAVNANKRLKIPDNWPWEANMDLLGKAAGGLFIWAFTAVNLVSNSDNPFRKLEKLITDSQSLVRLGLSDLYATVLRSSGIDWSDEDSRARFVQVLGLLLFSKVPLSSETIDHILDFPPTEPSDLILSRLQCVLAYAPGQPARLFHTSFSDYLLSPICKNEPWYIGERSQKHFLASRCFGIMGKMLRFNICDIETSFIHNDSIPGLDDRVRENIPQHLEYACLYWAQHLSDVAYCPDLLNDLLNFTGRQLLFWFEALSLLKRFATITGQELEIASSWASCDKEMALFTKDAARIGRIFSPCITQSVAHIYVSMLPIMKDESNVAAHYSKLMTHMSSVKRIGVQVPSALMRVLQGHMEPVTSVNFSSDGKHIVSGSRDNTILVWDAESGEILLGPLEGHSGYIRSVRFSPDGKYIVSGSDDKTVRIWDAESGKAVTDPLKGHLDGIRSVDFSPDGKRIVSGSGDNTIRVWDAKNGNTRAVLGPLDGHTGVVRSVNFSSDGKYIVSSSDRAIIVWDSERWNVVLGPLKGHTGLVTSVDFSPDGKLIVSGSEDKTLIVWNAESGAVVLGPLEGHGDRIKSAKFSPDGKRIVSGSCDKTIRVWDVASGRVVLGPLVGHTDWIRIVDFSPDGKRIVSSSDDTTIRVWDAESGKSVFDTLKYHTLRITSVNFSSDGKRILSSSFDWTIRVWDVDNGEIVLGPLKKHRDRVTSANFSPDGKLIVSGSEDKTIIVWDTETGDIVLGPLEGHNGGISSVDFSSDGKYIVSGSSDKTIIVWDSTNGNIVLGPLEGHSSNILSVKFSSDRRHIVSSSQDRTIRVWDVESGKALLGPLKGHRDWVRTAKFSPDGRRIVSCSNDGTIIVWDLESGVVVLGPLERHKGHVISVDFSPDGERIVSGSSDNTIIVWDAVSGEVVLGPLDGHTGWVRSVNFSPDGKRIASGSDDNTVRVWDVSKQDTSIILENHFADASSLGRKQDIRWRLTEDGWVVDEHGKFLLWVPYNLHNTLWRARNTAVFSCAFSTKIDFTNAALGTLWSDCFRPLE